MVAYSLSRPASESAVLALGHSITMPSGVTRVPVLSVAPQASFVSPVYGGRKDLSSIEWTAENLEAEEIALTAWIPQAFIDDSEFPVWESVRSEVAKAIALTLDAAVLYGSGAPASYPTGGIAALSLFEPTPFDPFLTPARDLGDLCSSRWSPGSDFFFLGSACELCAPF
jgi:HK97 family phage major capsid protein